MRLSSLFAATMVTLLPLGCSSSDGPPRYDGPGPTGGGTPGASSGGVPTGNGGTVIAAGSGGIGTGGATPSMGGSGSVTPSGGVPGAGGAPAAGGGGAAPAESYLGLPPIAPAQGFQLRSVGVDVPPGKEAEFCEVAQLPGSPTDVYWVNGYELGNAKGSHHLIVSVALPGTVGEEKVKQVKVGERVPCLAAQTSFGEAGIQGIAGIQTPHEVLAMAPGVGKKFYGGQYVIWDYHFMNSTGETIQARSAMNFHTASAAEIKHESLGLSILNYTIDTPAKSTKQFTAECHVKKDIMVGGIARHTHAFGTDYDVWYSGGARDGQHIWTSNDWDEDTQHLFAEPVLLKAGEGFRFRCGFDNTTTKPLRFGTSATDEMCILFANIWEVREGQGLENITCNVVWLDDKGVGHPADEAGGIPAAPPLTAALCSFSTASLTKWDDECKACTCNRCGQQSVTCALDADCGAMLTCFGDCAEGEDCLKKCQPTMETHSSGVGLVVQAQTCLSELCKTCPLK